jgi:hypothetical protein
MAVKENIRGFDFQARFAKEIGGSVCVTRPSGDAWQSCGPGEPSRPPNTFQSHDRTQ